MKTTIFIILFLNILYALCAQDPIKIDSLKIKLQNSREDTTNYKICLELSEIYSHSDLVKSLNYGQQSLDYAKRVKSKLFETRAQTIIGNSFLFLGIYDDALNNYLMALKTAKENEFQAEELVALSDIGIIKDRIDQFDEALEYYFKALNIYNRNQELGKPLKDVKNIHSLYNNIGNIYNSKKEYETAVKYYLKGLEIAEKKKDNLNIGVICNNLGKLEIERENFDKGYEYLMKSLNAREQNQDKSGMAKSYLFIGNYYKAMRQYDKALEFAKMSFEIGKEMKEQMTIKNSSMMQYEIYKETGKFEKALEFHEKFKNASDSLINNGKIEEMTRLQMQFDYEKSKKEKEEEQQIVKYTYIIILSTLTLILVILSLLFFLARTRNKHTKLEKSKLEEDMLVKNKELTTNVIYLMQKNELIDRITSRLLKLKVKLKPENMEPIQRIIFDLQSLTNNDAWNEFEIRFQSVHEQFYQTLQKKFPDLSPTEIKLAAFLRLNMTSKEIASITGQSVNSLETARYRLRKKLGINNQEVNLVNFLLNI